MRLISDLKIVLVFFSLLVSIPSTTGWAGGEEQTFLTEEVAVKSVFPLAGKVEKEIHIFTADQKSRIESRLGWTLNEKSAEVYHGFDKEEKSLGFALVAEEIGKFKPITFIVRVSNEGKVERIEVMVYRETVGAEVRKQRFLRQFKNKSVKDSLRMNRDILNITGATMSVQALTAGVKKALVILDELYGKK